MTSNNERRLPGPGGPTIPRYSSGLSIGGAEGTQNLWVRFHCHPRRNQAPVTHNIHTLTSDEKIIDLVEEMNRQACTRGGLISNFSFIKKKPLLRRGKFTLLV
ncbi:unnamed protein product [Euphydryas editha]|uniref:Uncharacterized protein n=1 Tax=Euphydryas editha TaxID=104508 RepID=A0AAU9UFL4_EUPED|nr:unnamed protein product [Euphydryas editha]